MHGSSHGGAAATNWDAATCPPLCDTASGLHPASRRLERTCTNGSSAHARPLIILCLRHRVSKRRHPPSHTSDLGLQLPPMWLVPPPTYQGKWLSSSERPRPHWLHCLLLSTSGVLTVASTWNGWNILRTSRTAWKKACLNAPRIRPPVRTLCHQTLSSSTCPGECCKQCAMTPIACWSDLAGQGVYAPPVEHAPTKAHVIADLGFASLVASK